jgi:hypothetical protein
VPGRVEFDQLDALRRHHPAWRLLRADNASLLLYFLGKRAGARRRRSPDDVRERRADRRCRRPVRVARALAQLMLAAGVVPGNEPIVDLARWPLPPPD